MIKTHLRKIYYAIRKSSEEELREIGIPQPTISLVKEGSENIFNNILELELLPATLYQLYHKFYDDFATIVGIDIGTHHYLSASDQKMNCVYTDESDEINLLLRKYKVVPWMLIGTSVSFFIISLSGSTLIFQLMVAILTGLASVYFYIYNLYCGVKVLLYNEL